MDDKPKTTPKDFFLWAGAMIALYASVFAFIALLFSYLNYTLPDELQYYGDPYASGVSYQMASLIVLFPIFLILMRVIRRDILRDPSRGQVWVRRWALYLTLFAAGGPIAGGLLPLIMYFFNGEVTLRFILKVLVVLLVAGGGFLHFLADLRGYWERYPARARMVSWATAALVLITIVAGFFIIGTPRQARLYRYDEQKVSDLQSIQYQITNYWQSKQALPAALTDLNDPLSYYTAPTDPQTGESYEYRATGATSFELCATFNAAASGTNGRALSRPMYPGEVADSWVHQEGRTCFARTIDPDFYPPKGQTAPKPGA